MNIISIRDQTTVPSRKIMDEGIFDLVDKFYGEFHPFDPVGVDKTYMRQVVEDLKAKG